MSTPARRVGTYFALAMVAALSVFVIHSSQSLVATERLVIDIVTSSPIGIVVCDQGGKIEMCNAAFAKIVGVSPMGQHITSLMPLEYRERFMSAYVNAERKGVSDPSLVYTHSRPLVRADGTEVSVIIHASIVHRGDDFKVIGFVTPKVP